ncbi:PAS domain-containing protein [Aestuariibacter salexigens]|uniref:PAS domain-containing protein n=1 Tax=Aestuariibacter salexigens TaxID=226010 RepID=UPI00040DCC5C|nr:PAS domain S-box protein [Aestuariibacter salexigens]
MANEHSLNVLLHNMESVRTDSAFPDNLRPEELFAFLSHSIECAADEVFWMRSDSQIFYVNNAACEKLGYNREEPIGMRVWEWDPLFPEEVWPTFWNELKNKLNIEFETLHRNKSGEVFPVKIRAHFLRYGNEELLFAFVNDITREKEQAALDHNNLLVNLTGISGTSMAMTDDDNRTLWINDSYQDLFGLTNEELEGKKQLESIIGAESDPATVERINNTLEYNQSTFEELTLYRKDGTSFWASLTIAPIA